MSHHARPVCGRCGVYRHLHPTERCQTSRRSYWLDEHFPVMHVTGWLWAKVPERSRWRVVNAMSRVAPNRWHWCDLVDAALLTCIEDYRDDWCDLPTPFYGISKPPAKPCYCNNLPYEPVTS